MHPGHVQEEYEKGRQRRKTNAGCMMLQWNYAANLKSGGNTTEVYCSC